MMIYLELFLIFFKIGAFTFGGGYAMLPLIQSEIERRGWLAEEELINFIAVSESTPGPFAVNISTYTGAELAGLGGAFCATLGVVLPSFIIILAVAKFFTKFRENETVSGLMCGLKPAVIGLIAAAALSIGKTVFFPKGAVPDARFFASLAIFAVCLPPALKKMHPILIICLSAVLGIAAGFLTEVFI